MFRFSYGTAAKLARPMMALESGKMYSNTIVCRRPDCPLTSPGFPLNV